MLFREAYADSGKAKRSGGITESGKKDIGGSMSSGYRPSQTPGLARKTINSNKKKDIGGTI